LFGRNVKDIDNDDGCGYGVGKGRAGRKVPA